MTLPKQQAYEQFAMWLRAQHPELFAVLLKSAVTLGQLAAVYRGSFGARSRQSFGDYADYFGDAASSVSYTADIPSISLDEIDVTATSLDDGPSLEQDIAAETA